MYILFSNQKFLGYLIWRKFVIELNLNILGGFAEML